MHEKGIHVSKCSHIRLRHGVSGPQPKQSLYFAFGGVGMVHLSSILSKSCCSIGRLAGSACFWIRTILVAQSKMLFSTILYFSRLLISSSAAFRLLAGQNLCLGHGGNGAFRTMSCWTNRCRPRSDETSKSTPQSWSGCLQTKEPVQISPAVCRRTACVASS